MLPLLLASLVPAFDAPAPRLADGKFGKALDAAVTPLAFGGDERYRTPPLTVECWAKLNSKRGFNVLVSSDPKSSSRHWEIYSYSGNGRFAAYLPGYAPSEVVSKKNIADREWHSLAMTFDGKLVRLFVDGKKVHEQAVIPRAGLNPDPGPLSVGQTIEGSNRVGCDGLIDDVRLSRVVREVKGVPAGPLVVDADTVAVWRFDGADAILADPAWTPPPSSLGEPWERETDPDWVDARLRKMDTGPTFNGTLSYLHGKQRVVVTKATAIRIGDKGQGGVIFDRNQLRLAAAWTGGYLQHSDRRFGLLNTPTPAGVVLVTTPSQAGWAGPDGKWQTKPSVTLPLPHEWGRFEGMYLHGKRVVLEYKVGDALVLESPWLETIGGKEVLTRNFEVEASRKALSLPVNDAVVINYTRPGSRVSIEKAPGGGQVIRLPAADHVRRFTVYQWPGAEREGNALFAGVKESPGPAPFARWKKPGPARWGKPLVTRGEVAKDAAPYVVDTLTVPYENPHNALMFTSGLDFLPDGRIAVCTAHGDVWHVTADEKLGKVQWQRFATGLYHPLGLKVVGGKVVVLERGQLTRLHDTNGDGEADWYENVCHDWHTGAGEHSYDTCLETDAAGNYYFVKTGDTDLPHGGCLLKVSADGNKVEVFATGFRHPIGLGVSPEGVVTSADQEGNWMPVTRVDICKKGGFYGDMRAHHRAVAPKLYDGPLAWLPKDVDNSAGGQAWVPHDRFGFPKGQLLHLSYGRCTLHAMLTQKVGDVDQAGIVPLSVKFLSGAMRMRFHPGNGRLYVCGLRGWQTAAVRDGCLQRVRYTGQPLQTPVGLAVTSEGVRLDFAQKLAPSAAEKSRYLVEQWNYRWSGDYGSKRWSVKQPDRVGQDALAIDDVVLSANGKSVLLKIRGLGPVMQMRIGYDVVTAGGLGLKGAVYNTIHGLAATASDARP